uniref:Partitioning defective protein 3 n=1 Tax=Steinernema glaseri TaxID=37863 RepID=A0A1I7YLV2_9BILA
MAIYSPKVTIHFGPVRVVVSTHPSMRVGDLASIAHLRYCKAVRKHPSTVRLRRLVAFRGRVILDPFDFVDDLFDHGFGDQILAIFDEPTPHQLTPTSCSSASSPSSSGHVVEVTNLSAPPPVGLKVDSTPKPISIATNMSSASSSSSSSQRRYVRNQNGRKSTDSGIPTRSVTLSPEIEKREVKPESESMIKRTDARKSRISEALFDKLEEMAISSPSPSSTKPKSNLSGLIKSTADPSHTIVVLNKFGASKEIGIEISGVPHPSYTDRLEAVEVLRIDPEGRVAEDGRFRVGDHLVELNERPVYQMSLARVRAYLHELASCVAPTVTVNRPIESFAAPERHENAASELKPVASALQQANTKQLGNTLAVSIVKGADGLGFTIRSRETTGNDGSLERLFYVATVKSDGAAQGTLRRGDRLLEVDGRPIAGLNQREVVERMKMVPIGSPVTLLISRLISTAEESAAPSGSVTPSAPRKPPQAPAAREDSPRLEGQILDFEIPVNDTGSAGLGISLKARTKIKPDNSRKDSGIFVKHIITGGAAYKDGRLMISDQIIGIEDVDLTRFEKNAQANEAITQCLRRLGPNVKAVRLKVRRVSSQEEPSNSSTIGVVDTTVASTTVTTPLQR